jgi:hypothetical protein
MGRPVFDETAGWRNGQLMKRRGAILLIKKLKNTFFLFFQNNGGLSL